MPAPSSALRSCWRVVCCLLIFAAVACTKWSSVSTPAPERPPDRTTSFRVTTLDGARHQMHAIFVRNDSLFGTQTEPALIPSVGIPVTDIRTIQVSKFDPVKTIALVGSVVVTLAAIAVSSDWGSDTPSRADTTNWIGSCPLVYSWDGHRYRLDSGTFGGAITPALARTDIDNLIHAQPFGGLLQFRMTAEADETEHVDAITVLAVDHPRGTTVAPDARANTTFHVVRDLQAPIAARDRMRPDILARVAAPDGIVWEPRLDGRDPMNPAHRRDGVELTFARPAGDALQLVIDGQSTEWAAQLMGEMVAAHGRLTSTWYDPATTARASDPMRQAQREQGFLTVSLWNGRDWQPVGEVWEAGPEVAKRQVLPIDVSGIPGSTLRVRLESAPAFWTIDYVGLGPQVAPPVTTHTLRTTRVQSQMVADGLERLASADGRMLDMERGDVVDFTVQDAPAPRRGMTRSYLLRSSGWYRIHGRDQDEPIPATLGALAEQDGAARLAVIRLNEALAAAAANAQRVGQH